jgi:uncharacterized protein
MYETAPTAPVLTGERMETLDAVRGVAVLGILLINIDAFSGYGFMTGEQRRALPLSGMDGTVWFLLAMLVEAKFYSLFSFLFGVGFAVFVQRAAARGADAVRLFKRRLVGLLLIGLVHTIFIWMGDILVTYAVLGFGLIPFLRRDDRTVIRWAIGMLAAPIAIYGVLAAVASLLPPSAGPQGEALPPFLARAADKFAFGNYVDIVEANLAFSAAQIVRRLVLMFHPRVFGMFLLGLYVGRRGLFANPGVHRQLLVRVVVIGLSIGLPLAAIGAVLESDVPRLPNLLGWIETTAKSISAPALALAYAAGLSLVFERAGWVRDAFALVGRMALTNYLSHSFLGILIFYGIGFGLFRRVPITLTVAGAFVVFALQIAMSRVWLARANFGPAEWIWRMFTYGRRFPLLRQQRP